MSAFQWSAEKREQILLAELAGFLHNIGKLDPNFLADVVLDADRATANSEIANLWLTITGYSFGRFAVPKAAILADVVRDVVNKQSWRSLDELAQELRQQISDAAEQARIDALLADWSNKSQIDQLMAGALKAVWQFYVARTNCGPLYFCLPKERQEKQERVDQLDQELQATTQQLRLASAEEKRTLGVRHGELKNSREEAAKKLQATYGSEQDQQKVLEAVFRAHEIIVAKERWTFADLLTLFWDNPFFIKPLGDDGDYHRQPVLCPWLKQSPEMLLPTLLILSHGEMSGAEKIDKDEAAKRGLPAAQKVGWKFMRKATAFGYEAAPLQIDKLPERRRALVDQAIVVLPAPATHRAALLRVAADSLEAGLGDTQWPINEITLWDYASTIASLFKSAVAKAVIEDKLPKCDEVQWRFLSIRYNGLDYLSRAHHVSDLLARQKALQAALDEVKVLIEVDCPLGNEVYRDENGSVLVVPHVSVDGAEDILKLPVGEGVDSPRLEQELLRQFTETGKEPLASELVPTVSLSGAVRGKGLRLTDVKGWERPSSFANPAEIARIWEETEKHGDICTVCGVRPQGYGASKLWWEGHLQKGSEHRAGEFPEFCQICKAQSRSLCCVCMDRRDERSDDWANNKEGLFKQTIWVDEVADNDGRLALVVGRFELDGWLSGRLIPTMMKDASFARVRRCWETTRKFWEDIEAKLPDLVGGYTRERLVLTPATPLSLGRYHAYDLEINGRYLSVVFAPDSVTGAKGCLLTADNLDYAQQLLAVGDLRAHLTGRSFPLHEPSGHGSQRRRRVTVKIDDAPPVADELRYAPAITILSEPALYLALVPADKALTVAQHIREKYELEMARVRDRLPLQVGLVFAPRRTPMRALLEAGQWMLKLPLERWERWQVMPVGGALSGQGCRRLSFDSGVTWEVPVRMGDYQDATAPGTADDWYPHFLTEEPQAGVELKLKHARDLTNGDEVLVRPSRFDFEFLDTTGRRLEISYDGAGKRRGLPTRPFLLEKLGDFDGLWQALTGGARKLGKSQLQNFEGALIERVAAWHGGDLNAALRDEVFQQFAEDTLHRLDQGWWNSLQAEQKQALERAARDGSLLDLLDLRMHILKEPRKEPNKENDE